MTHHLVMTAAVAKDSALDQQAIDWLLTSDEPGIRLQARRDLLGQPSEIRADDVVAGPLASRLLNGQHSDGSFGVHPYQKWMGAHWRLVSLVELGIRAGESHAVAAAETVLSWISGVGPHEHADNADGRYRVHASMHGNALAVCTQLGLAGDPRVRALADSLRLWQWPDGGWNCQRDPRVAHSSFYESLAPMWGLRKFAVATGDADAREAANKVAEFFLDHGVYKSHRTGRPGDEKWLLLRYPEYWHYDYLHGLVMLARAGVLPDPRAADAIARLREQQQANGRWVPAGAQYWKGGTGPYGDAAGWDRESASQMLTLNALRVLKAVQI